MCVCVCVSACVQLIKCIGVCVHVCVWNDLCLFNRMEQCEKRMPGICLCCAPRAPAGPYPLLPAPSFVTLVPLVASLLPSRLTPCAAQALC